MENLLPHLLFAILGMVVLERLFNRHMGVILVGITLFCLSIYFLPPPSLPWLSKAQKKSSITSKKQTLTTEKKRTNVKVSKDHLELGDQTNHEYPVNINIYLEREEVKGIENNAKEAVLKKLFEQRSIPQAKFIKTEPTVGYIILDNGYKDQFWIDRRLNTLNSKGFTTSFSFYMPDFTDDDRDLYGISLSKVFENAEIARKAKRGLLKKAKEKGLKIKSGRIVRIEDKSHRRNGFIDTR